MRGNEDAGGTSWQTRQQTEETGARRPFAWCVESKEKLKEFETLERKKTRKQARIRPPPPPSHLRIEKTFDKSDQSRFAALLGPHNGNVRSGKERIRREGGGGRAGRRRRGAEKTDEGRSEGEGRRNTMGKDRAELTWDRRPG
eukprot:761786-Hanusia_phi.AAC.1